MPYLRSLFVLIVLLGVLPGVAAAKEIVRAQVCGATSCYTFNRANSGDKLLLFEDTAGPALGPTAPAPWYRLKITIAPEPGEDMKPFTFTHIYVPSADLVGRRADDGTRQWEQVIVDLRPVLRNVSARLTPFPAAKLPIATPVADPVSAAPASAPARVETGGTDSYWIPIGVGAGVIALVAAGYGLRRVRGGI